MSILLVIERSKPSSGIWAMVWTAVDDDPRLLESKRFRGEAALRIWLAGITTRYGRSNITVNWTDSLRADDRLTALLKECVQATPPSR